MSTTNGSKRPATADRHRRDREVCGELFDPQFAHSVRHNRKPIGRRVRLRGSASDLHPRKMPKDSGFAEASSGSHAHDVEHVLAGVTHQVGADGSGKTSDSR